MTMLLRENAIQANLMRWDDAGVRYVLSGTGRRRISGDSRAPGTVVSFRKRGVMGSGAPASEIRQHQSHGIAVRAVAIRLDGSAGVGNRAAQAQPPCGSPLDRLASRRLSITTLSGRHIEITGKVTRHACHDEVDARIEFAWMPFDKPPAGSDWLHDVKHDGYRILARKEGSRATLWSRHGTNFTDRLPSQRQSAGCQKRSDRWRRGRVSPDGLFNGKGLRQRPLEKRRDALLRLVGVVDSILLSDALVAIGALHVHAQAQE